MTVALGMTGKRFDHTLAALDAVTRYATRRMIILVDEEDVALALTERSRSRSSRASGYRSIRWRR